jgi:ABC-type sugar transport system ATPase subunit
LADWCTAAGGQDVVLGIRPEDVRARRIEQPPSMAAATCGRVAIVESLGDQAIAYVELNQLPGGDEESKTNVTCKFPIREAPQAGDWVRLEFVADRLHLFDAQSGANLAREE